MKFPSIMLPAIIMILSFKYVSELFLRLYKPKMFDIFHKLLWELKKKNKVGFSDGFEIS